MPRKQSKIKEDTILFTSPRTNAVEICQALADCDTVLDIGCSSNSPLRFLQCKRLVGVDAYQPDLERAKTSQTHDEFIVADARNLASTSKSVGEFRHG